MIFCEAPLIALELIWSGSSIYASVSYPLLRFLSLFWINPGGVSPVSDISNPGQVLLKNLTQMSTGLYQCIATNEAGQESCVVQVTVQRKYWHITSVRTTVWAVLLHSCLILTGKLCAMPLLSLTWITWSSPYLSHLRFVQQSSV